MSALTDTYVKLYSSVDRLLYSSRVECDFFRSVVENALSVGRQRQFLSLNRACCSTKKFGVVWCECEYIVLILSVFACLTLRLKAINS